MRYELKKEYKDTSICPNGKLIVLKYLSQEQIKLVIKAGYEDYFTKAGSKKSKDSK